MALLESNEQDEALKRGDSIGGRSSDDLPKGIMMVQTQENNSELPVKNLNASTKQTH
jgi:hypothetical protein